MSGQGKPLTSYSDWTPSRRGHLWPCVKQCWCCRIGALSICINLSINVPSGSKLPSGTILVKSPWMHGAGRQLFVAELYQAAWSTMSWRHLGSISLVFTFGLGNRLSYTCVSTSLLFELRYGLWSESQKSPVASNIIMKASDAFLTLTWQMDGGDVKYKHQWL